ncbi:hypothetical protein BMT54_01610 [Pasteurellaceae bacterium 15-036681]|nr:hypothetical protein BMT54_01610 [Pasteurellaceae bacterium 15-036681]
MAVKDIFGLQSSYNLNNTYNDQVNWQDAFKMANSFAETSEKHRANRENLATSDWRVAMTNAVNADKTNEAGWNVQTRDATQPFLNNQTIANATYNTNLSNFNNGQLGGNEQLQQLQRDMVLAGVPFTPENARDYMLKNPDRYNNHAFTAVNQQLTAQQAAYKGTFDNALAQSIVQITDPLTGQVTRTYIDEQKLRQNLAGSRLDPNERAYVDNRYAEFAKQNGFTAPVYDINTMDKGFYRFLGTDYESKLTPQQRDIALAERKEMVESAQGAANSAFEVLNKMFPTPVASVTPAGRVRENNYVPTPQVKASALTTDDMNLVQQYATISGMTEQQALADLNSIFVRREADGAEATKQKILAAINRAQALKNNAHHQQWQQQNQQQINGLMEQYNPYMFNSGQMY